MINGFLNCLENKMVLSIYHYFIGLLSAYAEDHACVPKHRHETFRQKQALQRAGTG